MKSDVYRLRFVEDFSKKLFGKVVARVLSGKPPKDPKASFHSVLALRQDHLGDFVLTVPTLRALKRRMAPGGRLTIVTSDSNSGFARLLFPDDRILVFGRYFWSRLPLLARLAWERFDVVVDFHSTFSTTSALMAFLSGAPRRVGYWNNGSHQELSRVVFNLGLEPAPARMHESRKSLRVVQRLRSFKDPLPRAYAVPSAPPPLARCVESFYRSCGIGPQDFVLGIHPTLQKGSNCWAPKNYIELLKRISDIPRLKVVVVHGIGEDQPLKRFMDSADEEGLRLHALPETDVEYLLEASKRFKVVVAGDSGLAHLLSLQSFVIEIFGPSEPALWAPLGPHKILRAKDHRCDSVRPAQVAAEVMSAKKASRKWHGHLARVH